MKIARDRTPRSIDRARIDLLAEADIDELAQKKHKAELDGEDWWGDFIADPDRPPIVR
jgi:hypothetical protein